MNVEEKLGVKLTENLAMWPAASVSGIIFQIKTQNILVLEKLKKIN